MGILNRRGIKTLQQIRDMREAPQLSASGPIFAYGVIMETATFRLLAAARLINVIDGRIVITDAGRAELGEVA